MSVNYGSTNTSRYHTAGNIGSIFGAGYSWVIYLDGAVDTYLELGSNDYQYLISQNSFGADGSFHIYFGASNHGTTAEEGLRVNYRVNGSNTADFQGGLASAFRSSAVFNGTPKILVIVWTGSTFTCYIGTVGGAITSVTQSAIVGSPSASNIGSGTGYNFGRRADGAATRYYKNSLSAIAVFPSTILTADQAQALVYGRLPHTIPGCANYWAFPATAPHAVDLVGGLHAVRAGTGTVSGSDFFPELRPSQRMAFDIPAAGHSLTAGDLFSGTPTIESATVTHIEPHELTAGDLFFGTPTIESATLTQTHLLTAGDLLAGTPTLESATASQSHTVIAGDLFFGVPVIEPATLSQLHQLTAGDILAAAAQIESASLNGESGSGAGGHWWWRRRRGRIW